MASVLRAAGYGYIETPIFEETALFERGVGESTDVVTKEMYSFVTRGEDHVTLRPEGTAGVVRATLQHRLYHRQLPVKLWYSGSFFRYERPQAGRYRHFSQVGAESLGVDDPALDAELVALGTHAFRELGLRRVRVLLNSLGDGECRPVYRAHLQTFLLDLDLDAKTRQRAELNPLRVLDDKRPEVQAQVQNAPVMSDFLCDACRAHYDAVRAHLRDLDVQWEEAPRLVRGLDYYTRTTFEFQHDGLGSQSAVGGGGRYDGLAESLGGAALPGVGWALGVDRTVLAMRAEGVDLVEDRRCDVFAVPLGSAAKRQLLLITQGLRNDGIPTDIAFGDRGMKGSMKAADKSGARLALVMGDRDLDAKVIGIKDLAAGTQETVPVEAVYEQVAYLLARPVLDVDARRQGFEPEYIDALFAEVQAGSQDATAKLVDVYDGLAIREASRVASIWAQPNQNLLALDALARVFLAEAVRSYIPRRPSGFPGYAARVITTQLVRHLGKTNGLLEPSSLSELVQRDRYAWRVWLRAHSFGESS